MVRTSVSILEVIVVYVLSWTMTLSLLVPVHILRRRTNPSAETSKVVVFGMFLVFCAVARWIVGS